MNRQRPPRDYDDDELVQDEYYVPTSRTARPPRPPQARRSGSDRVQSRRKQRRAWPWLLLGCLGGIVILLAAAAIVVFVVVRGVTGGNITGLPGITNESTYTQTGQQPLTLTSVTNIQINDQVGVVAVNVDPSAATPTLSYVKRVKAASSSAANTEFNKISMQVQQNGSSLSVKAAVPAAGSILSPHNDALDLTLTLPQSALPASTATSPLALTVNVSIGDINVTGLSGVLNLTDQVGNVAVKQAMLDDGTHISTSTGNVDFSGPISTTPAAGNTSPHIKLQSETGNVTVTLPSNTNVTLDANTNLGKITSDFPINVSTSSGGANYYGPLVSGGAQPQMILTLDVSTGNVIVHQG